MKKFKSLLKAMLSQDMNLFRYKAKQNSSKIKKVLFPLMLAFILMSAMGSYAYMLAEPLSQISLTYVMLTLFIIFVTITTFMEGIYKSQGILFDGKDNDLLFSLPINKSTIFSLRIMKLLIFQFLYNLLFILPSLAVYISFENPGMNFYIVSFIMLFLLPIWPTIFACICGYIIKGLSTKFKAKKIAQTILSTIFFLGIFYASFNLQNLVKSLTENAESVNDLLTKIYYPAGKYISLIHNFDLIELIKFIAINILPLLIIIYLGSIYYFKIISKSSETGLNHSKIDYKKKMKVSVPLKALIKKEINRYFASSLYMFNTLFGVFIMIGATIALCINSDGLITMALQNQGIEVDINLIYQYLPKVYLQLAIFVGCITSITSSSISLEGKSFNITKSLPVSIEKIFLSKIICSNLITLPLMLISDLVFIIKFNTDLQDAFMILCFTFFIPTLTALIGLIINLKYPKMEWTSETEVIKQSMSTMISVWMGFAIFGLSSFCMMHFFENIDTFIKIELIICILLDLILWKVLKKYGKKKFIEINI